MAQPARALGKLPTLVSMPPLPWILPGIRMLGSPGLADAKANANADGAVFRGTRPLAVAPECRNSVPGPVSGIGLHFKTARMPM